MAVRDFRNESWDGKPLYGRSVDLRYRGQGYELNIPLTRNLLRDFETEHHRRYGYNYADREIELVTLRLRAILKSTTSHVGTAAIGRPGQAKPAALSSPEAVVFDSEKLKTRILSREDLQPLKKYSGPAIITEYSATTVIPPGKRFHIDKAANLIISR
jgi:N-methylhydantoinase A